MDSQPLDLYSSKKSNLVFGDNRSCISCRDKEGSALLCEVLDCQVNLCPFMFSGDSFKSETCGSDNLWTRKFVYKKHFKEENWFPFINELRNRTLWASGATGTGAKKHKLITDRLNLEINWSFLPAGWGATVKWSLEHLWRFGVQDCSLISWLAVPAEKLPFQQQWIPLLQHPSTPIPSPPHHWRTVQKVSPCCWKHPWLYRQQGTVPALQEGLDKDHPVKLLAVMSRADT